jgi:hypothetical protein
VITADDSPARIERLDINGKEVSKGSRVRLRPRQAADAIDMMLAGRLARVESIERDYEDRVYVAVSLEDDPGQDLGAELQVGHRFFFYAHEVEPMA